jgi:Fungal specific transcription factor domain
VPVTSPVLLYTPGIIPTPPGDIVAQDSDSLLEWLMSGFNETPIVPLPLSDVSGLTQPVAFGSLGDPNPATGNQRAEATGIQQLFKLIDDMSKRLSSDIHDRDITSDFLDTCMHEFFQRISPSFPVIHEPTFSSQKCTPPLLLNMVALGSLYVCLPNAVQKGELLWRLGHTAVATSWQTLISLRGPHDKCGGVQLVLTALLGQKYAFLSSNADIRTTEFVFHGLGFYWARTCGMYSISESHQPYIPALDASEYDKKFLWEVWAAS